MGPLLRIAKSNIVKTECGSEVLGPHDFTCFHEDTRGRTKVSRNARIDEQVRQFARPPFEP